MKIFVGIILSWVNHTRNKSNLIENASKYSEKGKEIEVQLRSEKDNAILSVTDHGVGIAEKDQGHILDKFVRVNNELSSTVDGNGLGLYLVNRIIDLHQGSIEVTSELGKGSTFIVRLPL